MQIVPKKGEWVFPIEAAIVAAIIALLHILALGGAP